MASFDAASNAWQALQGGALAESVGRLRRLQVLQLDDNQLRSLPEGLGGLPVGSSHFKCHPMTWPALLVLAATV